MAKNMETESWLLEQGGPAVLLRMHSLRPENVTEEHAEKAFLGLLAMEETEALLQLLDGFKTQSRDKKSLEYLIHSHKETCIDHFFPKLMDLGFRAGMPAFDERMWPLREVFQYLLTQNDAPGYYFRLMLHRFFHGRLCARGGGRIYAKKAGRPV